MQTNGDINIEDDPPTCSIEPKVIGLSKSPVQEHHIDFLLEEEFACNPAFLDFFLRAAIEHFEPPFGGPVSPKFLQPSHEWNCKAIRSVTTDAGETDVLAIYASADIPKRVCVLIEDKIRAGFQPDQPERYRERGEAGSKSGDWDSYWTCLIAPQKYAHDNRGFDTRVYLETLSEFFSSERDDRSRFKLGVLQRALDSFANTGLKIMDEAMTKFRAIYAQQAGAFFPTGSVVWPVARDAWWGDTWFRYKLDRLPRGAEIVYKSDPGFVDLAFRNTQAAILEEMKADCSAPSEMTAKQTGKSASFRVEVTPISDYSTPENSMSTMHESFRAVLQLVKFYDANSARINAALKR